MHETLHKDKSTPAVVPRFSSIIFVPGLLIVGLGLAVMTAWYAGYASLVQVHPSSPPMMFNTALLFTLSGSGLLAAGLRYARLTIGVGATVAMLGFLTLLQYFFDANFGLDELFVRDSFVAADRLPGRMALNTALAFVLAGFALVVMGVRHRHPHRHAVIAVLGVLVITFATVALFGYLSGITAAYTWGNYVGMAVHTAAGFLLLGVAFVVPAWQADHAETQQPPAWLPLVAGIAAMTVVVAIWEALRVQEQFHIMQLTDAALLEVEGSHIPELVLAFGGLLALTLALAVHKAQQSRRRARDFHELTEQASDGIVHSDTTGRLVEANACFCRMTGYSLGELRELHARDLFLPEDLAASPLRFPELLAGKTLSSERRLRCKDGRLLPVEIRVKRIGGRMQAIMRDLSERRQAEAHALRLGRMLDSSSNEFYAFDAQTLRFVQANQAALANLGYTMGELLQLTPLDIKPEFTPQTFAALLEPLRNGRKSRVVFETLYRRKNGSPYQVEVRLQLLPTETPPVFVGAVQDITERKDTEAQRHKLARVVDQMADPVIVTDIGGVIEYVNPAFERVTGYTRDEAFGRTPSFLRSGRHDDGFYRRMWEAILGGATFREVFINRRKDGSLYYEEKTITPLKDEHGLITHFISTGKDITEGIDFQERLQHLAQHDVLTQLPNRLLFAERVVRAVKRAASRKGALAVLHLGIDRFDAINATLGQTMGDQLLRVVAERLKRAVRESDTVARLGGNAFGVLLDGVASAHETTLFAQQILLVVAQPFPLSGRELFVTGSIGVGLYPDDGKDVFALLRSAESAMVRAVEQGGNVIRFHEAAMDARLAERLELETGLRRALEHKEFLLHYQPQMDLRTSRTCGVEALLRWHHPTRGLLEPAMFLPVLEETGLIAPVGVWVLRAACEQVQAWQATGLPALPITVKVSDREIADLDYPEIVRMVLEETGLLPSLLQLEINHRMLSAASGVTQALHQIGVTLVIGGFDVGTAPLGQLRQAHAAALKLDPGFVHNLSGSPEDVTLLRAIVAVAHEMRLRVMAEGVEQESQLRLLRSADCDAIMGFVFSKPLTAIEVARFAQKARLASQ